MVLPFIIAVAYGLLNAAGQGMWSWLRGTAPPASATALDGGQTSPWWGLVRPGREIAGDLETSVIGCYVLRDMV